MPVLEVNNLHTCFRTRKGVLKAVNDVSFALREGKTLALVGESGSGKSVSAMSVLRLLDDNGYISSGEIYFRDGATRTELTRLPLREMQKLRGNRISVIFQEPMTALNPVFSIGKQLAEPLIIHRAMTKKQALQEVQRMLQDVRITNPERVLKGYAHQLSGGMRQRVMIAMALACQPELLIADEPTTALDVTIQAQILNLMRELRNETGTAIAFITHDLGVVNEMCDRVLVMYCGEIMEEALIADIFSTPLHPYTEGLISTLPKFGQGGMLNTIPGTVPPAGHYPTGCVFAPRCKYATEKCHQCKPDFYNASESHRVRCFRYENKED